MPDKTFEELIQEVAEKDQSNIQLLAYDDPNLSDEEKLSSALKHYAKVSRAASDYDPWIPFVLSQHIALKKKVQELDDIRQSLLFQLTKDAETGESPLFHTGLDQEGKEYRVEIPITGTLNISPGDLI